METIYYITSTESPNVPVHIKINKDIGGAVLGFSNKQTAEAYLSVMELPSIYRVISNNDIDQNSFYGKESLLMFKNITEIEQAYKDKNNYDWSQLLTKWP